MRVGERCRPRRRGRRPADLPDAGERAIDRRSDSSRAPGCPRAAQLLDRGTLGQPGAAGHDEVGVERDDLLDIDAGERRDDGYRRGLGRGRWRCPRPCRRRAAPAPMANRVSVVAGVSETIFFGSGGDRDRGALVVGEGHREGRARGLVAATEVSAVALGPRRGAVGRTGAVEATRPRATSREDGEEETGARSLRRAGSHGSLRRGGGRGRARARAPRDVREGLPQPVDRMRCLPFLSKVEQPLRVGDRTSIASDGHRSGTVPDSHRLREHAVCRRGDDARSLALRRPRRTTV